MNSIKRLAEANTLKIMTLLFQSFFLENHELETSNETDESFVYHYLKFPTDKPTETENSILYENIENGASIYLFKLQRENTPLRNLENQGWSSIDEYRDSNGNLHQYLSYDGDSNVWCWFLLFKHQSAGFTKTKQMLESLHRAQLMTLVKKYNVTTCTSKDNKHVLVTKLRDWKAKHGVKFVLS